MADERPHMTLPFPIGGLDFSVPESLLDHVHTREMRDTLIIDGEVLWRPGYTQLASGYPNANPILEGSEFGDASGSLHTVFVDTQKLVEYTAPSTWTSRAGAILLTGDTTNPIFATTVGGQVTEYLYITNGKDKIKRWSGAGNWTDLMTTGFTVLRGKCAIGYKGYLILGATTEESNSYPYRVRWSKTGDPTVWNSISSGYVDLIEDKTNSKVMCFMPFGPVLIAYKFGSIYELTYQGDPNYFVPRMRISDRGTISRKGVASFGGQHFLVSEDNLHVFNGVSFIDPPPGNKIKQDFYNRLNWNQRQKICVQAFPGRFEVWVLLPIGDSTECNAAYCWNYKDNTWTYHEMSDNIYSLFNFNEAFSDIQPIAGLNGKVMKFMEGATDNGTDIPAYFRTKLHNYNELNAGLKTDISSVEKTVQKLEIDSSGSNPSVQFGGTNGLKQPITYESVKTLVDGNKGRKKADMYHSGQYLTLKVSKNQGDTDFAGAQWTIYFAPRGSNK